MGAGAQAPVPVPPAVVGPPAPGCQNPSMTNGGPEPGSEEPGHHVSPSGVVYPGPPQPPRLTDAHPRNGRQLAVIMGTISLFFVVLVALSIWAASKG
jgi:hypothetical protein